MKNACLTMQPTSVASKANILDSISNSTHSGGIIYIFIDWGYNMSNQCVLAVSRVPSQVHGLSAL